MAIPSIPGTCGLYVGAHVMTNTGHGSGICARFRDEQWDVRLTLGGWDWFPASQLAILLDDWQSMCFAARYLATRHGLNPGDTAPLWTFEPVQPAPRDLDGTPFCEDSPEMWTLVAGDGAIVFVDVDRTLPEGAPSWYPDDWIVIPGITKMGAAEALAAAINALS